MASATLSATLRSDVGKGVARKLRSAGQVPAVIYGHHREPQPVTVVARDLDKLLEHIAAGTTVVELGIDGRTSRTLIREIQRHPVKRQILHVDFQELVAGEKVSVSLPIVLVGIAEGVRVGGGVLDQTMRELDVLADPASMPSHIDVDVTALTIGHSIHVGDLSLPEGIEILAELEATICVVSAPKAVVETPAEGVEAVPAEPELIRKTKEEEESE